MNWGTKVIIVMVLFVSGIFYMISVCVRKSDLQLVTPDYYEQEIAYQGTIDKVNNYNALVNKPRIIDDTENMSVNLDFSQVDQYQSINGDAVFFRPSNSKLDFKVPIELEENGVQQVNKEKIKPGKWIVKLDWSNNGIPYYSENTIFIQ